MTEVFTLPLPILINYIMDVNELVIRPSEKN